ncbi:LPS assembly protein LptD [Luteolibacter pohnpeiensis]|uniref:LPS assembly protein LptD n=1 Tax=Luteolibacter pohnpeiensis TaxID=454153 RepID=A0A934S7A4_9BACT|nr:LPS assembly protein LptD [Luteolibacter pohnpeiensis]MBK1883976.1 LPS assembly protein LptD [Luteolibacter pohnpeiensis]
MSKIVALALTPLFFAPVIAQEVPELPENWEVPEVDLITPVPAPEIETAQQITGMADLPDGVTVSFSRASGNIYDKTQGMVEGDVVLRGDNGLEIFADRATRDGDTIILEGNVSVYQGNLFQRGKKAVYNLKTRKVDASGMEASVDPFFLEANGFHTEIVHGKVVYVGEDAGVTTHDSNDPSYWIRADETRIYPDDKITFKNLKLYADDVPVFWLPYFAQPLDADLGVHFEPGARSNWGPYLLTSYGIMLGGKTDPETGEREDAWILSKWHVDLRGSRGLGTGLDLRDTRLQENENIPGLSFYYLNDLNPSKERAGIPRGFVNEDRYRIELKQRNPLHFEPGADWYLDTNLTWLSDQYYLEDFNPELYSHDPFPDNTLGIFRRDEKSLLSIYGRFRLNDFYRTDTRLPEIVFDQARGSLFNLPFLVHEGTTSLGLIGAETADYRKDSIIEPLLSLSPGDPQATRLLSQLQGYEQELAAKILALPPGDADREALEDQLLNTSYGRFHTYQEFSLPMLFGGWLSFAPEAGAGYTQYWSVDGPDSTMDQTILHVGAEVSVKFSKDLGGYQNHALGIDRLLHVFQPYANWSVVDASDLGDTQPSVDRLTFTTRPRTLSPARYTATDDLQSWNTVRFGARNRLLTKRDGQTHEWLFVDTYMDAFGKDYEGDRNFSNLYNDVRWSPLPWLAVELETQFPLIDGGSGFTEFASRLRFMPSENFEFSLGYRFLDNHPVLLDSNRIDLRTYTQLNENWGFGTRHTLETDDGVLESQQYMLQRDLGSWVAGMGISMRDNRYEEEYGMVFSLTLKDFPSASLPFTLDAE